MGSENTAINPGYSRLTAPAFLAVLLVAVPGLSPALTQMSESEMSTVSGKEGVRLQFDASSGDEAVTANELGWTNDPGTTNEGTLAMRDVTLASPDPFPVSANVDAGGNGVNGAIDIDATWDELGLTVGELTLRDNAGALVGQSGGQIHFASSGGLRLFNQGLVNSGFNGARFDLSFSTAAEPGDFIIRHGPAGEPEFSFGKANLSLAAQNCATQNCTLGMDASRGLYLDADLVNLELNFDLMFKNSPSSTPGFDGPEDTVAGFDRGDPAVLSDVGGREPLIKFGWAGDLSNFSASVGHGAVAGSEGLHLDSSFDYEPNFSWILGKAGENRARAEFNNFERMYDRSGTEPTEPEFSLPLTLDVIPDTASLGQLCFGGAPAATCGANEEGVSLPVDRTGLAATIRNGHLRAYNTTVDVIDPAQGANDTYNWSLGYTFGRLDSNIVLYPGFNGAPGLTSDVVLTVDSPGFWNAAQNQLGTAGDNWATNTHFFIADTNPTIQNGDHFGFGLMNADLVWRADNMGIRIASNSDTAFASEDGAADIPTGGIPFGDYNGDGDFTDGGGGFWLQSSNGIRYQFRGVLGGGNLESDLSYDALAKISLTDIRLDTSRFVFALTPPPSGGSDAIGFEGLLDFQAGATGEGNFMTDGTYVSLAEPSDPDAMAGVGDLSGRIMWRNGKVEISSAADNPDNRPALTIANDLQVGSTAAGGDPLRGNLNFAEENLGEAVIPSGQFYSSIQLKPQ